MRTPQNHIHSMAHLIAVCFVASGLAFSTACSQDDSGAKAPAASKPTTAGSAKPAPSKPSTPPAPAAAPVEESHADLVARGRSVYMANCIACHSQDPSMDGALGPAVAGASLELLETRVMRGEYPPGYKPKRESRVMIPLPHLKDQLPALAAYLESFPK